MGMKIKQDVIEVLDSAEIDGNKLRLTGQLDRKLYADVNKVLEAIGGKWNKSAKAHVFEGPVVDVLDPIMETGEYSRTKQDFGQFDSPSDVVARVIQLADIGPGMDVLEPSAGVGNIVRGIVGAGATAHAFEIDDKRRAVLEASGLMMLPVARGDFLTFEGHPTFDRVAMNPPFAGQADIDHVLHAAKFLKPGGKLAAVMSAGTMFRSNRKAVDFRNYLEGLGAQVEELPTSSFASEGTEVRTCIVSFTVP